MKGTNMTILELMKDTDHGIKIILGPPERANQKTSDWILFDPEDRQTWPPLNVLVLTQSKTGRFGLDKLMDWKYGDGGIKWFEPNIGGVGPIDMMTAWHPLPEPYIEEVDAK